MTAVLNITELATPIPIIGAGCHAFINFPKFSIFFRLVYSDEHSSINYRECVSNVIVLFFQTFILTRIGVRGTNAFCWPTDRAEDKPSARRTLRGDIINLSVKNCFNAV